MKMIQDALSGKIDLILTKSISRFGRNTMDVLKNVRLLRDNNVAVLFEENNLNTLDTKTSEMLLTTLSAVAQQESENISEHVKLGLQMKMNRGELIGFNRCYGYRNENDKLVIVDEEAEVVKFIFDKYCDGHGANGQEVSGYLSLYLPQNLNEKLLSEKITNLSDINISKISEIVSSIFIETNMDLISDESIDTLFSGSTCCSIICTPKKIISINVGDSRCVVGKFDGKNWKAKNLSRDHKPSEEDEFERIIKSGGRVESYKNEDGDPVGPERVWLKDEDFPGLAMSRSFGDEVAHSAGVIAEPEISEYYFVHEDKFVIIASDGIFEFISSDECVSMLKNFYLKDDIDGAMYYLYKESSKKWIMEEEVIDDISMILIFLN
jgi:serine/threonine protein phosphatase PrpC